MITIERRIQTIHRGKWAELEKLNEEFDVEGRFDLPSQEALSMLGGWSIQRRVT